MEMEEKRMTAILFDIDDTLYDQVTPFGQALAQTFPHMTGITAAALFKARSRHSEDSFRRVLAGEMTMEEMYYYRIRMAFAEFQIAVAEEEAMAFQRAYEDCQEHLTLPQTMERLLAWCRERQVVLGIISNGPADHQRAKTETLGMGRFISPEHIIISGEEGVVKPDIRIFRIAEKRLGLDPGTTDIWYVGDSFENDIMGAKQAGWKAIWLNRRRRPLPEQLIRPDRSAYDDEELFAVIREIVKEEDRV